MLFVFFIFYVNKTLMELITGIALAAVKLAEINKGLGNNNKKYPALNTSETDPEILKLSLGIRMTHTWQ
jgi:hypothetical protein